MLFTSLNLLSCLGERLLLGRVRVFCLILGFFLCFLSSSIYAQNKNGQLYYFISFSLPDSLIKQYLHEAALNKGILVLRGISPGMSLHNFLLEKLLPLLKNPENPQARYANIEINPNLFIQYNITQVPTLVYSLVSYSGEGERLKGTAPENLYWKVAGSVSGAWAMEQFTRLYKSLTYAHEQTPE